MPLSNKNLVKKKDNVPELRLSTPQGETLWLDDLAYYLDSNLAGRGEEESEALVED